MISEKMGYNYLHLVLLMPMCISSVSEPKYKPKSESIAPTIMVTHYDCSEMTENNLYSLNQVKPCNLSPENIELSTASVNFYTQHFRTEINATICSVKHQRNRYFCGVGDHASIDVNQPQITSYLDLSPTQCRDAALGKPVELLGYSLKFTKGEKQTHHKYHGDRHDTKRNECDNYEWMTKDTFESHIQDIQLKVRLKDGRVFNRNDQLLPCSLEELGCESTSLDPYAYTWQKPENCIFSVLKEDEGVSMIKNDEQYYILSSNLSESKYLFEVKKLTTKTVQQTQRCVPHNLRLSFCRNKLWWIRHGYRTES